MFKLIGVQDKWTIVCSNNSADYFLPLKFSVDNWQKYEFYLKYYLIFLQYLCHYLLSIKQWISAPSAPGGNGGSGGSDEEYHGGSLLLPLCLTLHRDMYLCPVVLQNEPQILGLLNY